LNVAHTTATLLLAGANGRSFPYPR
jgi:hypothetical protein